MSNRTYKCHNCGRSNNYFQKYCNACEMPAAVASLRSTGKSNLPINLLLPLLPSKQSIGSNIHSDILLPSLNVPEYCCDLNYADGLFYFYSTTANTAISFNSKKVNNDKKYALEHGCIINFSDEEFELIYFNKYNRSPKLQKPHLLNMARQAVSTSVSRQLLSIAFKNKLFECHTIADVFSLTLDTALLMTGLERAYGFINTANESEEIKLNEILAKNSDFITLKENHFTISQSIINSAIKSHDSIYISNSDIIKQKSASMYDFDIKTIICLPLSIRDNSSREHLLGILYLDKQYASHHLPKKLTNNLKIIASMATKSIYQLSNTKSTCPPDLHDKLQYIKTEIGNLKSHLQTSSALINKYQHGNPSAIKTRLRECRKDLHRLSKIISGSSEVPSIQKL
ncbi:hypothetical protein PQO01_10795 [Lentisphaera marina]|uniref:hypothetical protein n=1 Tax=Lentisphaera marina TaxID=1111041 RepID=UPI002364FCB3|nr:hypothetical protein [Lentisphaera marina]MDD7985437.1 hypothetical protein [Lentisphaera marina]